MEFKFIDDLDLGVTIDLKVLQRDSQRYSTLLYQHEGTIAADNNSISNLNLVDNQFQLFFEKAIKEDVDLALTPEYSCPWNTIKHIVNDPNKWPKNQKLWIVGAESITPDDITTFKSDYGNEEKIIIYYDLSIHDNNKRFVDPSVYIFTEYQNGNIKLVVIIQFKNNHMGVWGGGIIERDNLIVGNEIYVLRNPDNSINLITVICSDALNFRDMLSDENKRKLDWEDKPYMIIHPQLNPKPSSPEFIDFRKHIFQSKDKEIISLNWQVNTSIGGEKIEHCSSRSSFYIKSDEINFEDRARIINNHRKGLYYFYNKKSRHTFLLSSTPSIFLIETLPVKISGVQPVQARRDGPEVKKVFVYSIDDQRFNLQESIDDSHIKYLNDIRCFNQFLLDQRKCILEKERLVCLSIGKVESKSRNFWWKVQNIYSVYMNENNEINKRLTVARNESEDSMRIKNQFIEAVNELKNILETKDCFPDSLNSLKDEDLVLSYYDDAFKDDFRFNITSHNGEPISATVAYIGVAPESQAKKSFVEIRTLFNRNETGRERISVFYKSGNEIKSKSDTNAGNVIHHNDYDDTSILKSEEL